MTPKKARKNVRKTELPTDTLTDLRPEEEAGEGTGGEGGEGGSQEGRNSTGRNFIDGGGSG